MDTWLEGHTEGEAEDGIQNNGSERKLATKKDLIVIQRVRNGVASMILINLHFGELVNQVYTNKDPIMKYYLLVMVRLKLGLHCVKAGTVSC
jgi:hypothetical protein